MSRRILITGASRGIGRSIATKLADNDSFMYLHGRDKAALEETLAIVQKTESAGEIIVADLSDSDAVLSLASHVSSEPLDLIVNNAAIAVINPVEKLSLDDWNRTLAVNVTAPFLLARELLPKMNKGGSIVNILSVAAKTGFPGWSSYCMSKFALEGFSQSLREELREREIRVINIYPAATATDIWTNIPGEWPEEKMLTPDEVADAVVYALSCRSEVLVGNITLGTIWGSL